MDFLCCSLLTYGFDLRTSFVYFLSKYTKVYTQTGVMILSEVILSNLCRACLAALRILGFRSSSLIKYVHTYLLRSIHLVARRIMLERASKLMKIVGPLYLLQPQTAKAKWNGILNLHMAFPIFLGPTCTVGNKAEKKKRTKKSGNIGREVQWGAESLDHFTVPVH